MADPRIGIRNEDGTREWPETTIEGQPYTRPINEAKLSKRHFVVFSTNGITPELYAELVALVQPPVEPVATPQPEEAPAEAQATPTKKRASLNE